MFLSFFFPEFFARLIAKTYASDVSSSDAGISHRGLSIQAGQVQIQTSEPSETEKNTLIV